MKYSIYPVAILTVCFSISSAPAQNKVVVVPLGGSGSTTCTAPDEVRSAGNRCWKDRNLGARNVASSSTDSGAYGDTYQWGRLGDGHQNRGSSQTQFTTSPHDVPGNAEFIITYGDPFDWRLPQNNILWQGLGGVNNPCPQGFRLPTVAEWNTERLSWSSNNAIGAFASPLKLVLAGYRPYNSTGSTTGVGSYGAYWSSTVDGTESKYLGFHNGDANTFNTYRSYGFSVRCIKD